MQAGQLSWCTSLGIPTWPGDKYISYSLVLPDIHHSSHVMHCIPAKNRKKITWINIVMDVKKAKLSADSPWHMQLVTPLLCTYALTLCLSLLSHAKHFSLSSCSLHLPSPSPQQWWRHPTNSTRETPQTPSQNIMTSSASTKRVGQCRWPNTEARELVFTSSWRG